MRKITFLLLTVLVLAAGHCSAIDHSGELISLIRLTPGNTSQKQITSLLGAPGKVEESKKRIWWHYAQGDGNLVICWNKKSERFEKFSFSNDVAAKCPGNVALSRQLKSGVTDLTEALKLLGTPRDMTIQVSKQEMRFAYQNNKLRLFFRNGILVDFCLY